MKTSKDEQYPQQAYGDPKDFLLAVMNDQASAIDIRIEAAAALMPYFHTELSEDPGE